MFFSALFGFSAIVVSPQPKIRSASPSPQHAPQRHIAMLRENRVGAGLLFPAPRAGPRLPWRRCVFGRGTCTANRPLTPSSGAGPHPFSTPAPNTPDTCTKNRHYLRQTSCFPVIRVFRQNAAREGRSYAPGWGLRCANCRDRPGPPRDHRHIAQEDASCTPVRRRAATGLPARQGFPVGLRAPQWHIAMLRAARLPGWFARRSRRSTYGQKKPRKKYPVGPSSGPTGTLRGRAGRCKKD